MVLKCYVTNCTSNYNAENKVKTFSLPKNPEERMRWITIIPRENIPNSKTLLFVRHSCLSHRPKDHPTLTSMESYVPVTHPHCLVPLNQAYFPLFHLHQEEMLERIVKLETLFQMSDICLDKR